MTRGPDDSKKPKKPTGDYETGYGKPPKQHQFKPGECGNPKGRPKGQPTLNERLMREAARLVRMDVNGSVQHIPIFDVVLRRLFAAAAKGNIQATALLMKLWLPAESHAIGPASDQQLPPDLANAMPDDDALRRIADRIRRRIATDGNDDEE